MSFQPGQQIFDQYILHAREWVLAGEPWCWEDPFLEEIEECAGIPPHRREARHFRHAVHNASAGLTQDTEARDFRHAVYTATINGSRDWRYNLQIRDAILRYLAKHLVGKRRIFRSIDDAWES